MSKRYIGGLITKSPVTPNMSAAPGIWTLDQAEYYAKSGAWPKPPVFYNQAPSSLTGFSVYTYYSAGLSNCQSFVLDDTGTKAYAADFTSKTVYQYPLSTAYDLSTIGSSTSSYTPSSEFINNSGAFFNPTGTIMYLVGVGTYDGVHQYSLSTPFNVSTASYTGKKVSRSAANAACISTNGLNLYITNDTSICNWYTLSTPFDVSTATYQNSYALDNTSANFQVSSISQNGVYVVGSQGIASNGAFKLFTLSTPFNISTASLTQTLNTTFNNYLCWAFFNPTGTKMYAATTGSNPPQFWQYNL